MLDDATPMRLYVLPAVVWPNLAGLNGLRTIRDGVCQNAKHASQSDDSGFHDFFGAAVHARSVQGRRLTG
jgi:hypothetical protein